MFAINIKIFTIFNMYKTSDKTWEGLLLKLKIKGLKFNTYMYFRELLYPKDRAFKSKKDVVNTNK